MGNLEIHMKDLIQSESKLNRVRCLSLRSSDLCLNSIGFDGNHGGLLLEDCATTSLISMENCSSSEWKSRRRGIGINVRRGKGRFSSVKLSDSNDILGQNVTQGIKGFWKGNFVNILRTAPFKAINFYSYEKYRDHLLKITGNEEATNVERFIAGAAAGITATVLCIPMDTVRTVMVAPGGESLGGLIGTTRHMIQTEGFFSLYKGLVPSIISMAPSGAVFYGVYDILKSAYLHSPEGRKRLENMKHGEELNALDQLELGTVRTLVYGAIAGACAEAATYPFEVVRRQLQLQVQATKMSALATSLKIVEQGGIPALYAGLTPSLLQLFRLRIHEDSFESGINMRLGFLKAIPGENFYKSTLTSGMQFNHKANVCSCFTESEQGSFYLFSFASPSKQKLIQDEMFVGLN
ncbi:hypothetical protein RND71_014618 [Anisodus tanguticus]|uniref:Mitochondrial adenine nucleotide transporter BTL3 n=1 Tax=Anisodus tanguticus TaxID=243964 RepID=A0AAE1SC75_9SOLA|nr:hypothetical protein RND71_014618 [Anisodus tanguticus]